MALIGRAKLAPKMVLYFTHRNEANTELLNLQWNQVYHLQCRERRDRQCTNSLNAWAIRQDENLADACYFEINQQS